ncbi:transposase [Escherichia coli]|uniref:transposase n=2 Tax=Escherichia coli TaxID=562 RepID=UPI0012ABE724|nr:transposase [Escherichia coli]
MELQDWRKEPRKNYSNEFKLRMVELASQPGACVAQIARENGVNDNVIFKWLRLWQNEGRVSRRLPVTTSSDTGVELLPVEITPDEQKEPVAAIAPSLSTSTQVAGVVSIRCGLCSTGARQTSVAIKSDKGFCVHSHIPQPPDDTQATAVPVRAAWSGCEWRFS